MQKWQYSRLRLVVGETVDEDSNQLIIHPAGRIEFTQNIVPLDIELDKVGDEESLTGQKPSTEVMIEFESKVAELELEGWDIVQTSGDGLTIWFRRPNEN